jgi:hypothetical protein
VVLISDAHYNMIDRGTQLKVDADMRCINMLLRIFPIPCRAFFLFLLLLCSVYLVVIVLMIYYYMDDG